MIYFDELSMTLLIQQNESLQKEFAKLGYNSTDEGLEQIKMLIKNNFLNYKCKRALEKVFKANVENATGYLPAMYEGLEQTKSIHEPVDGQRFYIYDIHERNGEYEYNHKHPVQLDADQNPDEWLEEYTSEFYGEGDKEDDYYWFNGELICTPYGMTEISKDEFNVVKRYM
jgi:hypothetical protein